MYALKEAVQPPGANSESGTSAQNASLTYTPKIDAYTC